MIYHNTIKKHSSRMPHLYKETCSKMLSISCLVILRKCSSTGVIKIPHISTVAGLTSNCLFLSAVYCHGRKALRGSIKTVHLLFSNRQTMFIMTSPPTPLLEERGEAKVSEELSVNLESIPSPSRKRDNSPRVRVRFSNAFFATSISVDSIT